MARLELSATNADAMEYVVPFEVGLPIRIVEVERVDDDRFAPIAQP
jgi:hypothetical protein